jgi:hypothetical protein
MKTIIKLAVFLLIVNALWQVVPPYWRYREFERALQDLALKAGPREAPEIAEAVMGLAADHKVPVLRENVHVTRERTHTYIDVTYVERATPVPGWTVTRLMEIRAEALRF